jgi:hypothetical protein
MVKFFLSSPRKKNPGRFNGRLNSGSLLYDFCNSFDLHNKCNKLKFNSINMVFIVILSIIFLRIKTSLHVDGIFLRFRLPVQTRDGLCCNDLRNTLKHSYKRFCFVPSIHPCILLFFDGNHEMVNKNGKVIGSTLSIKACIVF